MRSSSDIKPHVFIVGAVLVIILALSILYFLNGLSSKKRTDDGASLSSLVGISAVPDHEGWRSLFNGRTLDGWKITNFGPQGPVVISDSAIFLIYGDGCTGITWKRDFPDIDYELYLEAMRVDGHDFFCGLTFPVFDEHCTLIIGGWGGSLLGISSIDGKDASENFTQKMINFENNRWYEIRVRVDREVIKCYIDDQEVIHVPVDSHIFSVRSEVGLSRPMGICSWVTTAALKNIRFRAI